jgi:hypothetical protein
MSFETTIGAGATAPLSGHARWTLTEMLRGPLRDARAVAGAPIEMLLTGSAVEALAPEIAGWGFGGVTVATDAGEHDVTGNRFDVVVTDLRASGGAVAAARPAPLLLALGDDPETAIALLRGSGYARIERVEPPADAERSLVKGELVLLAGEFADGG